MGTGSGRLSRAAGRSLTTPSAVILPDVTVLVGAFRLDATQHVELRGWVERTVEGPETFGLTDAVLGGTLRVLTHPRVFAQPTPLADALDLIDSLRAHPNVSRVSPGPRHWDLVAELCRSADARGNLVADAQHAAVAIEHGATWVSQDRDFARFPRLRWVTAIP